MRLLIICIGVYFFLFIIGGCSNEVKQVKFKAHNYDDSYIQSYLGKMAKSMVIDLKNNFKNSDNDNVNVFVVDITNVVKEENHNRNKFSLALKEKIKSALQQESDINLFEFTAVSNANLKKLMSKHKVYHILKGVFQVFPDGVSFDISIIDVRNSKVMSSSVSFMPLSLYRRINVDSFNNYQNMQKDPDDYYMNLKSSQL